MVCWQRINEVLDVLGRDLGAEGGAPDQGLAQGVGQDQEDADHFQGGDRNQEITGGDQDLDEDLSPDQKDQLQKVPGRDAQDPNPDQEEKAPEDQGKDYLEVRISKLFKIKTV